MDYDELSAIVGISKRHIAKVHLGNYDKDGDAKLSLDGKSGRYNLKIDTILFEIDTILCVCFASLHYFRLKGLDSFENCMRGPVYFCTL